MSSVSAQGLGTLLALIFAGPIIYLVRFLYKKFIRGGYGATSPSTEAAESEPEMGYSAFVFALVGYAIGIGNVWRFPYVIATNGGSAALFAYLVCAALVAWPLFTYELIFGQYISKCNVDAWPAVHPRWKGLGYAQFMLLFIIQTYMQVVIAYTLPYIKASCIEPLPYSDDVHGEKKYWETYVLGKHPDPLSFKGLGGFDGEVWAALLIMWIITFFSVSFGKKLLAKITYVTVLMPVVLMIVLLIVTVRQPGASDGIAFYIGKFDGKKLGEVQTWATACAQILFSLSPGFGSAITYASFIGKKEDVYKASAIVCVSNSAFSILAGFAVFSIVGSVAYENGITVEEAATEVGTGLAFFTIAEAMGLFGNAKNAMSVLFYVMLFTLGLDSSYANFETLVAFVETALHRKGYKPPLWTITLSMSVVMFLLGLIFCTRKGTQVLGMIDMYIGTMLLLFICCCEGFIFNFGMGWKRLTLALQAATIGNKGSPNGRSLFPNWLCRLDLHVTVPIGTGFLFIYQFVDLARNPYGGYPASTNGWGWALLVVGLAIAFSTIWKRGESQLPPIEDDPRFQEVLNAEGIKGEGKNDETARDGKDDAEEEFVDKEAGDLDGSEKPIDVGGEAPVMEAVA